MNTNTNNKVIITLLLLAVVGVHGFSSNTRHHHHHHHVHHTNNNRNHNSLARATKTATFVVLPMSSITTRTSSLLHMSVEGGADMDAEALQKAAQDAQAGRWGAKLRALYKFTRPHTIRGTILASIAGTVRALRDTHHTTSASSQGALTLLFQAYDWGALLPRALIGMLALLFGNAFIVGINQIYDKPIDKLNKPFLPVASGEMSVKFAWTAVITSAVAGPLLVYHNFPALLFRLYSFGLFLGLIYSVPPIRTKQNPIAAGLTIATVRGFLLNFGIYYAVRDALQQPFMWSPKVAFCARFMTIFATVIAVTKDLPDIQGDRAYNIDTLATKLGVPKIAYGAAACLGLNYVHAVATGVLATAGTFTRFMIPGHVALAAILIARVRQLKPSDMTSVKLFYKHVWDLFYLEYVLYTLI